MAIPRGKQSRVVALESAHTEVVPEAVSSKLPGGTLQGIDVMVPPRVELG